MHGSSVVLHLYMLCFCTECVAFTEISLPSVGGRSYFEEWIDVGRWQSLFGKPCLSIR